jgi:hypothetical protein
VSRADMLELHARELARMPDTWSAFRFECFPKPPEPRGTLYYEVEGAVCPLKTAGKGRGQPNYRKMDRATRKTITITVAEQERWETEWAAATGKCPKCMGTGEVFARWAKGEGTTLKPCDPCGGTGGPNGSPAKAELEALGQVSLIK